MPDRIFPLADQLLSHLTTEASGVRYEPVRTDDALEIVSSTAPHGNASDLHRLFGLEVPIRHVLEWRAHSARRLEQDPDIFVDVRLPAMYLRQESELSI